SSQQPLSGLRSSWRLGTPQQAPPFIEPGGGARSDARAFSERRRGGCRERASSARPGSGGRSRLGGQWLDAPRSALGVRAAAGAADEGREAEPRWAAGRAGGIMDPSLLRDRELFKKRALSNPVVEKRSVPSELPSASSKKKKAKVEHGGTSGSKQSAGECNCLGTVCFHFSGN
ncbi:LOW QUALITY PROTEIN: hypothetical protein U0070_014779, partial [Myodes glareolus]